MSAVPCYLWTTAVLILADPVVPFGVVARRAHGGRIIPFFSHRFGIT